MSQHKYQVKHGFMWLAKFNYEDPVTHKIKTEYKRGFTSKRDARAYEEHFMDNILIESGELDPVIERTFEDVYYEYITSHRREDIKESSLKTKFNIFEKHIFPTFRNVLVDEITDDDIASWQAKIKECKRPDGASFSPSYLRTIQSQFNCIINYAFQKGYMHQNPLVDVKNMGIKDKRVGIWTTEEYERFAYHAMQYPEAYYAFEILYWCGLRQGEMFALTLNDIDFKNGLISVTKSYQKINGRDVISSPKTPSSVRTVSMPGFLVEELKEYVSMLYEPQPDERIFKITRSGLSKVFYRAMEEAGLDKITVHGLRHSHASLLINRKYDIFEVSKRIGHKSVTTTQDIYGHLFDDVQRTIANDLDNMRRG